MEDSSSTGDEPSFVVFREPSMPRWRRQPVLVPKNLSNSALSSTQGDSFKVFLRIKPSETGENKTHVVIDSQTIVTHVPEESVSSKVLTANNKKKRFSFTSVMQEDTTQKEVFETCVLPCLDLLLRGEDSLVMAYGTTSAGKTFTMHGTSESPGIIPRVLSHIFRVLKGSVNCCDYLLPHRNHTLMKLSDSERANMRKLKNTILALDLAKYQKSTDTSSVAFRTFSGEDYASVEFAEMQQNVGEYVSDFVTNAGETTSVWISMVEIYGENIFDLLTFPNERGDRPSLSLSEDGSGGFYVKNAQLFCVQTGHEAHQITQFGRSNLHRACTALNSKSSRSHCLLSIVLVDHRADGSSTLRRITLADLAGSERAKKTNNLGKRLMESNSINKSLSVLGNCLKVLKENQTCRYQKIVPVRDSRLTKLLKNALSGLEKLTFIVNISTDPILFDETLAVLKFSALAQEIISESVSQPVRPSTRLSQALGASWASSMPDLSFRSKSSLADSEILTKQLQESRERENKLEDEVEKWKADVQVVSSELVEMSMKAEDFRQMVLAAQKERELMGRNLSDHYYKVVSEKNQERDDVEKTLRAKHAKEIQQMNECIRDLRRKVKELESGQNDEKYSHLMTKYSMIKQRNKDLEASLEAADQDFDELTKHNKALEDERNMMAEGVERLSAEMAELRNSLTEEQLLTEQLQEENFALQSQLDSKIAEMEKIQEMYRLAVEELEQKRSIPPVSPENEMLVLNLNMASVKIEELEGRVNVLEISTQNQAELGLNVEKLEEENERLESELWAAELAKSEAECNFELERERVADLESEVTSLQASVDDAYVQESHLKRKIEELQAALHALEQEADIALQQRQDLEMVSSEKLESVKLENITQQTEIKRLTEELKLATEKLEELNETHMALKDEDLLIIQRLQEDIQELETELNDKSCEIQSLEERQNLLIELHEKELLRKQDEIEGLRKDVPVLIEAKKFERIARSPLRNTTNIQVPTARLVEFSPFIRFSKSARFTKIEDDLLKPQQNQCVDLILDDKHASPLRENTIIPDKENVSVNPASATKPRILECTNLSESIDDLPLSVWQSAAKKTPRKESEVLLIKDDNNKSSSELNSSPPPTRSTRKGRKPKSRKNEKSTGDVSLCVPSEQNEVSPKAVSKSTRKPRTAKKRDPLDHPALSKNSRGGHTSPSSATDAPPPPRSVKKQLFSADDFVDFDDNDDDDFVVPSAVGSRRPLRTRSRRN